MRRSFPLALLLVSAAVPRIAAAWSEDGHRIVAAIAEERLSPAARRLVREAIGDRSIADRDIAMWADDVRDKRNGPWHYVNIPLAADRYDARRDCPKEGCAVSAVERFSARLRDADDALELADSLRWLVHLVGDLHQPLHAGEGRDRGGNDTWLAIGKRRQPESLHRFWDVDVVAPLVSGHDPVRTARELSRAIPAATAAAWRADLAPAEWADESHLVARAIYSELRALPVEGDRIQLPAAYAASQRARTAEALSKAGVRLAALLDRIAAEREARRPAR